MKKILALVACLSLVASLAIGGSIAYLTDRDSAANVFTIGNVEIDLTEGFEGGSTLLPGKDIEKSPKITNTGSNEAWVWATIAFPAHLDNDDASKNVVHFNYSPESVAEGLWNWKKDNAWNLQKNVDINGVNYNLYTVLYETALKPGETTAYPVMTKVYMDPHVDIDLDGNVFHIEKGVITDLEWNIKETGDPIIYVSAYAVQKEGFETVWDAFDAYGEQWGDKGAEYGGEGIVSTSDKLVETLENGGDVIMVSDIKIDPAGMSNAYGTTGINVKYGQTINGNGHTLDIKGAGGTWDSGINTTGGLIKNIKVTGSFRGIFINHTSDHSERVILENVIVDGTVYTISCDQGLNQGLTAKNSTFNGWTSFAKTIGDARFENCNFGAGSGYNFSRPYAPTEYVNCIFAEGHKIDPVAKITFENCKITVDGKLVDLTADNKLSLVIKDVGDPANASVK